MKVYVIHLYRDRHEEQYCGSWAVAVTGQDADRVEQLGALGFGCGRDEDGTVSRGFFLADEIEEQERVAARTTECFTVVEEARP